MLKLTSSIKFVFTFRTFDLNLALVLGNPKLLLARWAFDILKVLVLLVFLSRLYFAFDWVNEFLLKLPILRYSLVLVGR